MYVRRLAAILVGATIALAGCGSDDPDDNTASGSDEQSSENGTSEPEEPGENEEASGELDLEDLNLEDLDPEALAELEDIDLEDVLGEDELACYNQSTALLSLTMAPLSIGSQAEDDMSAEIHAALDELSGAYPDLQADLDALGQMVDQSADVDMTDPDHLISNTEYETTLATVEQQVNDACGFDFGTE